MLQLIKASDYGRLLVPEARRKQKKHYDGHELENMDTLQGRGGREGTMCEETESPLTALAIVFWLGWTTPIELRM